MMEFLESRLFSRDVYDYLSDEEYRAFQLFLADNPKAGAAIQGTGGLRKIRWAQESRGKGKRSGVRVIYFYLTADHQILLMAIYDKDTKDDLSANEKKALRTFIEVEIEKRAKAKSKKGAKGHEKK